MSTSVSGKQKKSEEESLPLVARIINHVLTPGSSLTTTVWASFNVIMAMLFCCWLLFVFSFPDNIHVWAFGLLGGGLLATTNWFMYEIFSAKEDFASLQLKKQKEEAAEAKKLEGSSKKESPKGETKSIKDDSSKARDITKQQAQDGKAAKKKQK